MALGLVHCDCLVRPAHADSAVAERRSLHNERAFHGSLPENVIEMREEILAAIHGGDIGALAKAAAWSESKSGIKVDFGPEAAADPVAYWKRVSADGAGAEILAIAANLLDLAPTRLALGKDFENTFVYVWPYLAELPAEGLSASETVDLLRLVPYPAVTEMRSKKRWRWWRLVIAADGTWLVFRRYE